MCAMGRIEVHFKPNIKDVVLVEGPRMEDCCIGRPRDVVPPPLRPFLRTLKAFVTCQR